MPALDQLNPLAPNAPVGSIVPPNTATTRRVNAPTETVAGQYAALRQGPLAQRAAQKGAALAQLRGSQGNDTIFARASEDALAEQLVPIAQQDAQTYGRTSEQNMEAQNQNTLQQMQGMTSIATANIGAGASMYSADRGLEGDRMRLAAADRQFNETNRLRQQEREQDRTWQTADAETARRANGRAQIFGRFVDAMASDPSYWRDPQGATGMINFFSSNLAPIWDRLFTTSP